MAPRVTSSRVEPKDYPEQSHRVHPVFPSPWRGGRPPHGLRIRITQGSRLRRGCQPASPRGLAGLAGRSAPRGLDALREISTVPKALPSTQDTPAGLQRRGLGSRLRQDNRGRHKLSPPWEGPYVVVKVLKPGTYKLANEDGEELTNAWNI
jgi:hypothetical protein